MLNISNKPIICLNKDESIFPFGIYLQELNETTLDFTFDGVKRNLVFGWLHKTLKNFRTKAWFFQSLDSKDFFISFAVVDLKFLSMAFVYIVDKVTNDYYECSELSFFPRKISVSQGIHRNKIFFKGRRIVFSLLFDRENNQWLGKIECPSLLLSLDFKMKQNKENLNLLFPLAKNRPAFTFKDNGVLSSGSITFKENSYQFNKALSNIDYTKGLFFRITKWYWANFSFKDEKQNIIGLNASQFMYDQMGISRENAIWVNEKLTLLQAIEIKIFNNAPEQLWLVQSSEVDLNFRPLYFRRESKNLFLINSQFVQAIGYFNGEIKIKDTSYKITNALGIMEDHYSKW